MFLHFFLVGDNRGEFYEWGIEGDVDKAMSFLESISNNVKFLGSEDISTKNKTVGNRKYADGVICRLCKFKYRVGTMKTQPLVKEEDNESTG